MAICSFLRRRTAGLLRWVKHPAQIVAGAASVRIHGKEVPIRVQVIPMQTLSAHADADEIMQWLRGFKRPPRHTYVVHGGPNAADVLLRRISVELGWSVSVPEYRDTVELSGAS